MTPQPLAGFERRAPEWERLRGLVGRVEQGGLGNLTELELWELPSLYRKALSDLSLARSAGAGGNVEHELGQLCSRAHAIVYGGTVKQRGRGLIHYIFSELPQTARRRSGLILAAAFVMTLFSVVGFLHASINPSMAEAVLGPQMMDQWRAQMEGAKKEADFKLAAQIETEERPTMWLLITFNNIKVSFAAMLYGVVGGLPSLIVLGFNGYMVGALGYLYFSVNPGIPINLPLYFIAGIAPHGSIELPAICVAAAAGMLLGFSWLFPGKLPRGQAFREAFPDALRLIMIVVFTLICAGILEAFVTPLQRPTGFPMDLWFAVKIALGAVVFGSWLLWLSQGGLEKEAQATKDAPAKPAGASA